ncbi:MAG: 2-isopropylmalate synthase [Mobilibacterium timonense]|nr:2-isopropylmalate synthase [Mobilibacterium timonense]
MTDCVLEYRYTISEKNRRCALSDISLNKRTNLLEQDPYNYQLQDVEEPNLMRDFFEYTEVPKVSFNFRRNPLGMPEHIWITDTTFRDGQQSRAPFTVDQIVDIYKMMSRLSGPNGILRQTEFFVYSDKDKEAVQRCMDLGLEFPEVTTWIRAKKEDFKLVHDIGVKETGILVSCSDYHIFKKLGMNRRQAMEHYLSVISDAFEAGVVPRCHLEDITRADFYGFVVPFVKAIMDMSKQAKMPVRIRACDTLGYGIPYNGVSMPRSVSGIVYGLQHYAGVPSEMLEWHGHNDFYKAVTNAATAWLYGASAVNCTLFGIGERTGNVPLEAMVFEYAQLRGTLDGMDTTVITDLARYFENKIGYHIPEQTPFVGKNFNVTKAGIHADGLMKDEEIYNIFDTAKFLKRPPRVSINQSSGAAGIALWINEDYGLEDEHKVDKHSPVVAYVKKWVDEQYAQGRVSGIGGDELHKLIHKFITEDGITSQSF